MIWYLQSKRVRTYSYICTSVLHVNAHNKIKTSETVTETTDYLGKHVNLSKGIGNEQSNTKLEPRFSIENPRNERDNRTYNKTKKSKGNRKDKKKKTRKTEDKTKMLFQKSRQNRKPVKEDRNKLEIRKITAKGRENG